MQKDILFDNIYIGHSIEDAEALKKETWDVKHPIEAAQDEKAKPKKDDKAKSPMDLKFLDDPVLYITEKWNLFITIAQRDPIEAIRFVPEIAGGIGIGLVTIFAIIIGTVFSSTSAPEQTKKAATKAKEAAADAKDKAVDAAASGVETAKTEATKRATRSTGPAE